MILITSQLLLFFFLAMAKSGSGRNDVICLAKVLILKIY